MRPIDADKLLERMKKGMESGSNLNGTFDLYIEHAPTIEMSGDLISRQGAINCCSCLHPEECWDEIRKLPSAVEVVRCKDCEHGEYRQDFDDYECGVDGCGLVHDADFYCSDGERREP